MPTPDQIFGDEGFRSLTNDQQKSILSDAVEGYGKLPPAQQQSILSEGLSKYSQNRGFAGAFGQGFEASLAQAQHLAGNILDIAGADELGGALREDAARDLASTELAEDASLAETFAFVLGNLPVALGTAAGAVGLAGTTLPAWAAPIVGFGALGALGAADQGVEEALKAGATEAAFGALFPATQQLGRIARTGIIGGAAYGISPEEERPDLKLANAVVMGVLAGIPNKRLSVLSERRLRGEMRDHTKPTTEKQLAEEASKLDSIAKDIDAAVTEVRAFDPTTPLAELLKGRRDARPGEPLPEGVERARMADPWWRKKTEKPAAETLEAGPEARAEATRPKELFYESAEHQHRNPEAPSPDVVARSGVDFHAGTREGILRPPKADVGVTTEMPKHPVRLSKALYDLAKALGAPLKTGPMLGMKYSERLKTLGYTSAMSHVPWRGTVRTENRANGHTAVHELGHYIDIIRGMNKRMWDSPEMRHYYENAQEFRISDLPQWAQEMHRLSYDVVNPAEGVAEGFRAYMTNKPYLTENAPAFLRKLEESLQHTLSKNEMKKLLKAQDELHKFYTQGGQAGIQSGLGPSENPAGVLWTGLDQARQAIFDGWHGVLKALERSGVPLEHSVLDDFYRLRSMPTIFDSLLRDGVPKIIPDPRVPGASLIRFHGKGLMDILVPVARTKEELQTFFRYVIARNARELENQWIHPRTREIRSIRDEHGNLDPKAADVTPRGTDPEAFVRKNFGREKLFTPDMIESGMQLGERFPHFKDAFSDLVEFHKLVDDFYEQSGLINAKQRAKSRRSEYAIGFFRDFGAAKRGLGSKVDPLGQAGGMHMLRGSSRNMNEPLYNLIYGPSKKIQAALENMAELRLVDTLSEGNLPGRLMEKIPETHQVIQAGHEQIESAIRRELSQIYGLHGKELTHFMQELGMVDRSGLIVPAEIDRVMLFLGAKKPYSAEGDILTVMRHGRPEYYQVWDPGLKQSLMNVRPPVITGIMKHWNAFRRFKQAWITRDPTWMTINFIRDQMTAGIMSKTGNFHLWKSLRGMYHIVKNSQEFKDFKANGAGGATHKDSLELTADRIVNYSKRHNLDIGGVILGRRGLVAAWDALGRAVENSSRMGEWLGARAQGQTASTSARWAREVSTDFSIRGTGGAIGFLGQTIPFFHAMLAGADRAYRAAWRDPHGKAKVAAKMAGVGLSSMMLYALNREVASRYGPEQGIDWDGLDDWMRDIAWHIYIPTEFDTNGNPTWFERFMIPKIWEIGSIGTLAERFLESLLNEPGEDADIGWDVVRILAHNFNLNLGTHAGFPVPLPVGLDTMLEQYSNTILFTGQPIETLGMENLLPYARARSTQTETIKEYGKAVQDLPIPEPLKSPARAEALLRSLIGEWANMGLQLSDQIWNPGGPALHLDQWPIVRRLYRRVEKYDKAPREFYERSKLFSEMQGTMTHYGKMGDIQEFNKMARDEDFMLQTSLRPPFDRANRWLQTMNQEASMIRSGAIMKNNTQVEKAKRLETIRRERLKLMKSMNDLAKAYGK